MKRTATLFLAALIALAIASPAVAGGEDHFEDDLVVFTGGARIDEDQAFDDVVIFDDDVTTAGEVRGDLIAFNGDLEVTGSVGGDVVVFNGDVVIRSGATIEGDLASRREPTVEDGAEVGGEIRSPNKDFFRPIEVFAARVALWVAATASLLLLGLLLIGLAPRPMDSVAATWESSKGAAALWGLLVLIGIPVGAVLLMLTVVGIPFGIGTLLALGFIYAIAYTVGAWALGRSLVSAPKSRALAFLAGFAIVRLLGLIPIVGGIVSTVTLVFGLGLLWVTIWRSRKEPAPAPASAS
ncbi:MAG: hypothetical protein ACRDH9_01990 [Actinomycetota bacterium]